MTIRVWSSDPEDSKQHLAPVFHRARVPFAFVPLESALTVHTGDVVLVCGGSGYDKLKEFGIVPKNRAIGSLRGKAFGANPPVLLTYDPKSRFRDSSHAAETQWDAQLAVRLHETGSLQPVLGTYAWGTLGKVRAWIQLCKDRSPDTPIWAGMDLETMTLWPWYSQNRIVTSQWSCSPGYAIAVHHLDWGGPDGTIVPPPGFYTRSEYEDLRWILTDPEIFICGANLKFDLTWIQKKWGIRCTNFTFDTLLMGSLEDENRSNSLKWHTKLFCPDLGGYEAEFEEKHDKSKMELVPKEDLLTYCAGDADAALRCAIYLYEEMSGDPRLLKFYIRILHPAARAFEQVEYQGVLADRTAFEDLAKTLESTIVFHTEEALRVIPQAIQEKYEDNLSINRPDLIRDCFFGKKKDGGWGLKAIEKTEKQKKPSTSLTHLQKFVGQHAGAKLFVENYMEVSKARKVLTSFVNGFLKDLRPDGYFHPTYILFRGAAFGGEDDDPSGAATGRLACRNPSLNTTPKRGKYAKPIRQCFPAPEGYWWWQLDADQGELRIVSMLAPELNMQKAFQSGIDIHANTAAGVMGIRIHDFLSLQESDPEKYAYHRDRGKALGFGLLFGMSAPGFVTYAYNNFGLIVSLEEAELFRNQFLYALYPGLPKYHERQEARVRKDKMIRNPLGRIRHLPLIDSPFQDVVQQTIRQSINAEVQTTLNDIVLLFTGELDKEFADDPRFSIRISTHDSLGGYVAIDHAEECIVRAEQVWRKIPGILSHEFGFEMTVPLPIAWELGETWGSLQKVKVQV